MDERGVRGSRCRERLLSPRCWLDQRRRRWCPGVIGSGIPWALLQCIFCEHETKLELAAIRFNSTNHASCKVCYLYVIAEVCTAWRVLAFVVGRLVDCTNDGNANNDDTNLTQRVGDSFTMIFTANLIRITTKVMLLGNQRLTKLCDQFHVAAASATSPGQGLGSR